MPKPVNGAFQWSPHFWPWKAPDALLIQTACCYEQRGVGHLFEENRKSMFFALEKRLQGISGEIMSSQGVKIANANITIASVSTGQFPATMITSGPSGFFHQSMEPGKYSLNIEAAGFLSQSVEIEVTERESAWQEFVLHTPYSLTGSRFVIAMITALILLCIVFYFLYTSFQSWKWETKHGGFERVPLNDFDLGDESEDDILDLRTIKP